MTEPKILLALAQQLSHDTFCAGRKTNPKKFTRCMSPPKGEGPGDTIMMMMMIFVSSHPLCSLNVVDRI